MYITRYSADPRNAVNYIKANLKFIGNITSFEVYFNKEDIPEIYRDVPDVYVWKGRRENQTRDYTLILRDEEHEREIWLSDACCGYDGSGPSATKEILQLLGIPYEYDKIFEEKVIIEKNLVSNHDLNMVVFRETDMFDFRKEVVLKVKMSFNTAYSKDRAKTALNQIGYIQPLSNIRKPNEFVDDIDDYFFRDIPYSVKGIMAFTNYALTLKRPYSKFDDVAINKIIEDIRMTHGCLNYHND